MRPGLAISLPPCCPSTRGSSPRSSGHFDHPPDTWEYSIGRTTPAERMGWCRKKAARASLPG